MYSFGSRPTGVNGGGGGTMSNNINSWNTRLIQHVFSTNGGATSMIWNPIADATKVMLKIRQIRRVGQRLTFFVYKF